MQIGYVNSDSIIFGATKGKSVKAISGINCAKCGKKMLSRPEKEDFYSKVTITSSEFLQTPEFANANPKIQKAFISMAEAYPDIPLFTIYGENKAKPAVKGLKSAEKIELYKIILNANQELKEPKEVIKHLVALKKNFPEMPKHFADFIDLASRYSKQYPNAGLIEIFKKPEIIEIHRKLAADSTMKMKKKIDKTLENIEKLGKKLPAEEREKLERLNQIYIAQNRTNSEIKSLPRTGRLYRSYNHFIQGIKDKNLAEKIRKELNKFPQEKFLDVHHFIMHLQTEEMQDKLLTLAVKQGLDKWHSGIDINKIQEKIKVKELSDKNIVDYIVDSISSTFEHMVPAKDGGSNLEHNGLFFCTDCNFERKTLSYQSMVQLFPDFAKNINAQIQQIIALIKDGQLPEYVEQDTLVKIKETLKKLTTGQVIVDIKDYLDFRKNSVEAQFKEASEQLQTAKEKSLSDEKAELLQNKLELIEERIEELKKQKFHIRNQLQESQNAKPTIGKLTQDLAQIQLEKAKVEQLIEEDK